MAPLSPMMQQYCQMKEQYPDTLLFFRLGDFYEMFFEDAKTASKELELVLTGRDCGQEERAPMCGVPYHSCDGYIARLVAKGYKVAICEQMEDPATTKGLVKREVVRVITPGTVTDSSMLDETRNNYLAVITANGGAVGLCFVDASTGELHLTEIAGEDIEQRVCNELGRFHPREALLNTEAGANKGIQSFLTKRLGCLAAVKEDALFDQQEARRLALEHFHAKTLEKLGLEEGSTALCSLGGALRYLFETEKTGLDNITEVNVYTDAQFMRLDLTARHNLELFETMRGQEKRGSLLWVLDRTQTAMGKRMLRRWLEQPLMNAAAINRRLSAVEELTCDAVHCAAVADSLSGIHDMERLITRVVYGTANARELQSLSYAFERIPALKEQIRESRSAMLLELCERMDELGDMVSLIQSAIVDEPPLSVREGGLIRPGYNAAVDEYKSDMTDGKGIIARIEAAERERTGIKSLKVGFNRVFGYYIEITNTYRDQVPEEYIRKQTLTNCERYITQELKELEYDLFVELRNTVGAQLSRIQRTASAVAMLDAVCSLASVAIRNRYCRPDVVQDGRIVIRGGRHPVVERLLDEPFVPNDTLLDAGDNRCYIITGPNMAGKSTYMRQVALITVMAHIGSFVPAESASIGLVDAVFTRVGASDDLSAGQSTFMVEMSEVANIIKNATSSSLLILDEIGRGTSTYDGMSIARAVLEHVVKKIGAKTFFATHYHELTELEGQLDGVLNYSVAVKKRGDDVTFLRRIVRGGADESYGIEVARLAGIPDTVVRRSRQILRELDAQGAVALPIRPLAEGPEEPQMSLTGAMSQRLVDTLRELDVDTLTPLEALTKLYELVKEARQL